MSSDYVYVVETRTLAGRVKGKKVVWRWRSWSPLGNGYHTAMREAIYHKNAFSDSGMYQARIKKYKLVREK